MRRILIGTLILVGSLVLLYQGLVPSLLWFMDTDLANKLFYVTTAADNKDRSMLAFEQCKAYARQEFEEGSVIEFHSQDPKDLKIWKVINDYIVKSRLGIQNPSSPEMPHKYLYVCKLRYTGGDDTQQANWALLGFDLSEPEAQKLEGAGPGQPPLEPKSLGTDE